MATMILPALRQFGLLDLGVVVGDVVHRDYTLRPATLADSYRAAAAVPVPANVADDQAARVAYQMAIDDAQILCQLEALGSLSPVPAVEALAEAMDPDDMAILRQAAAELKKKLRQSRHSSPPIDAPNTSSSAPASA